MGFTSPTSLTVKSSDFRKYKLSKVFQPERQLAAPSLQDESQTPRSFFSRSNLFGLSSLNFFSPNADNSTGLINKIKVGITGVFKEEGN